MSGYKELNVYQKSYKAVLAVYEMSKRFPKEEVYSLTNQIRRSAASIPLNIAEGYAKRSSQQEFKRYLEISLGSSNEVSVLLDLAKDLGYIEENQYRKASSVYAEISRMINGMIKSIKARSNI